MIGLFASEMDDSTTEELIENALDITGAELVDVKVREDKKVLWVNVNGICVLRVCQIKELDIT